VRLTQTYYEPIETPKTPEGQPAPDNAKPDGAPGQATPPAQAPANAAPGMPDKPAQTDPSTDEPSRTTTTSAS
jgi:hypothetical protein